MAPHEKVFVDRAFLEDENHGEIDCHDCHGGNPGEPDFIAAHDGLVRDPTTGDATRVCGDCHEEVTTIAKGSLHVTLKPFQLMIDSRSGNTPETKANVDTARNAHCGACHASCGQCHISRPSYVGGGFLDGHQFIRTPPMREVCTACHGSRIENEYFGKNQGSPPDVHWRKRFFRCIKCHTGEEMHGDGQTDAAHRYEAPRAPRCEDCHLSIYAEGADNAKQHRTHREQVSCQVCHSVPYKNCSSCHVALDRYGFKYFNNDENFLGFKIGLNPQQSLKRPQRFVTLRHVPVAPNLFDFYVENGLAEFDALPTWKLATPHNIRRITPQNKTCNACHGNKALFLLSGDVSEPYRRANAMVMVPETEIPPRQDEQALLSIDQGETP
ncbi:hypothetical protein [Desulfovibrio ferrophilus]|uniref:hypothetical protein n=1 Tax=Desulfovibrio ferrophilus TaxID=241368 RepID=UPI000F8440F7|nr:hypothetical protein [Desulfovibrio ferrophilus]